jgi:hypothetical protein
LCITATRAALRGSFTNSLRPSHSLLPAALVTWALLYLIFGQGADVPTKRFANLLELVSNVG